MIASTRASSRSSISAFLISFGIPGIIPSTFCSGPIFLTCCICSRKSSSVNVPSRTIASALRPLLLVERRLGLLDERHHVAHAEDAARHAVGVERLEVLELLAGAGEEDRLADHFLHRQRRAATRVAVDLGEDHAVEADGLVERLRDVDRFLTGHRVDDEQRVRAAAPRRGCGAARPSARRRSAAGRRCRRSRCCARGASLLRSRCARP